MVPGAGLQPARPFGRGILSPLRLAISPPGRGSITKYWRRESESNRRPRLCRPLHDHSAIPPQTRREGAASAGPSLRNPGAGNESRTRDLNLGKVALYQLSYSRVDAKL